MVDFLAALDGVVVLVVVNILLADAIAQGEFVRFLWMAADQGHDFGFFTFCEAGKNLVDGEAAEADDGPAKFLAGRVRNELLRRGIVGESACNIGGGQPLADFDEEAAAGDFSCERINQGCASVSSGFVACGFLLGAS